MAAWHEVERQTVCLPLYFCVISLNLLTRRNMGKWSMLLEKAKIQLQCTSVVLCLLSVRNKLLDVPYQ